MHFTFSKHPALWDVCGLLEQVAAISGERIFGKLFWRLPPHFKQYRKSVFRIDLRNKDGSLVILNGGWGEREREMHTEREVLLLSFRETKREITVIKINEKKE